MPSIYKYGPIYATIAMLSVVVISNYLVQFFINDWLTWGALPYPIAFLITECINRIYGVSTAKKIVYMGFVLGVIVSLICSTPKIAIASGSAFLTAQLLDIAIFNRFRQSTWWYGPLFASVAASAIDTALFTTMAFWGEQMPILTLAIGDFSIKMMIDIAMLAPFRFIFRTRRNCYE